MELRIAKHSTALDGFVMEPYSLSLHARDGSPLLSWTCHPASSFVVIGRGLIRVDFDPHGPLDASNGYVVRNDLTTGTEEWRVRISRDEEVSVSGGFWNTDTYLRRAPDQTSVEVVEVTADGNLVLRVDLETGRILGRE